jgi:hypothetical protein
VTAPTTIIWAVPTGVVTVDVVESRARARRPTWHGMPVDASAAALVIFAHLDDDEIAAYGPLDDSRSAAPLPPSRGRSTTVRSPQRHEHRRAVLDAWSPAAAIVLSARPTAWHLSS